MQKVIQGGIATVCAVGKAAGILATDPALAQLDLDAGALFVAVGVDTMLLVKAASGLVQRFGAGGSKAPAAPRVGTEGLLRSRGSFDPDEACKRLSAAGRIQPSSDSYYLNPMFSVSQGSFPLRFRCRISAGDGRKSLSALCLYFRLSACSAVAPEICNP
ncbi:hypothetical protein [Hydrogenophaga sp. SL48]|uniref:hypothetical protein n=1 Tax=Hydrogenophaga sp. SL48 TaxID=2806347 RepID=UPI001F37C81C|nr:hypothetical protein [Hydrogenophaga sp. SL48]UJW80617.1 hypothetical protein IM738_22710 [Hydrogenophaga sp. SL48]